MKVYVFIGIFGGPGQCELYRDPRGQTPQFRHHSQAGDYIHKHGLGPSASPIEISVFELPSRMPVNAQA